MESFKCTYCFKPADSPRGIFVEDLGVKYICRNKVCMNALLERVIRLFEDKNDDQQQHERRYTNPQLQSPIFEF